MKKTKKLIIGFVLTAIGITGLSGMFSETDNRLALLVGSALFLVVGVGFIYSSIPKKNKETTSVQVDSAVTKERPQPEPYIFHPVKVVGVTFKNDDGTNRQSILRKIKQQDAPFESGNAYLSLETYEFEGEPAVGVYVDGIQIGNLSREEAKFFVENYDKIETLSGFEVVGGGTNEDGEKMSYGARFNLKMRK